MSKNEQPTLTQIAKLSGYSIATVSRALAGSPRISAATRKKVLLHARQCFYRPRCRSIAIVTHGFENYFSFMLEALHAELLKRGYRVWVIPESMLALLDEISIQGVISLLSENGLEKIWGTYHACPLLCINTGHNRLERLFSVTCNDEKAVTDSIEKLYRSGHRLIGKIGVKYLNNNFNATRRDVCFQKLAAQLNFTAFSEDCLNDNYEVFGAIRYLLDQNITALICTSEILVHPVLHALSMLRVRIPEELSVITWSTSREDAPDIETYVQDYSGIAETAVQMLTVLSGGDTPPQGEVQIDYHNFPGHSIGRAAGSFS